MLRTSLIGVLMICFASCQQEKRPDEILSEREMVKVLSAIYLAEETIGAIGVPYDSVVSLFPRVAAKTFESTGIPDSVFRKSMEYYKARPAELEKIYGTLIDSLSLKAQVLSGDTTKRRDELSR